MGTPQQRFESFLTQPGWLGEALGSLEAKSGVGRSYLATGFIAFVGLYLMFGYSASLLCNLVGFAYPAYVSIYAIKSPTKEDNMTWLTYWVVYGMFFSNTFLYWFHFYYAGKCLFLLWCMASFSWNGSQLLYRSLIRPWFLKHQQMVDRVLSNLSGQAASVASMASREVAQGVLKQTLQAEN